MGKPNTLRIVHLLCTLVLLAGGLHASDDVVAVQIGRSTFDVRASHIYVRMRSARTRVEAQKLLPARYTVAEPLLDAARSVHFSSSAQPRAPQPMDPAMQLLWSSEEQLTRTFAVEIRGIAPLAAVRELATKAREHVELAEPWYVMEPHALQRVQPNDPMQNEQQYLATISALAGWEAYSGDTSVVIAISDNGVSQLHEDLRGNIARNWSEIPGNEIDDDGNGYVDDALGYNFASAADGTLPGETTNNAADGHGTKVSGLAAAAANNGVGITGIGNRSRFFPMKVSANGSSSIIFGYQSLIYAAQRKFSVVNTSWGRVKPFSALDQSVIDYCRATNVLVVASAGNYGSGASGDGWRYINYPSGYHGVLGVGETDKDDYVQSSSGLGGNAQVMAPGSQALTTEAGGGYTNFNVEGTSFASPIVAGVAALVRGKYPSLTTDQVIGVLRRTADDISSKNSNVASHLPGRVNMQRALTTDPMSLMSCRIASTRIVDPLTSRTTARYRSGDSVYVVLTIANDLRAIAGGTARLRVSDALGWSVRVAQESVQIGAITSGGQREVSFTVYLDQLTLDLPCILALEIEAGGEQDRAFVYLQPPSSMTTFTNGVVAVSMGDDGAVGYNSVLDAMQGDGFGWLTRGYQLMSPSGFFLTENNARSSTGYADMPPYRSDFAPSKVFVDPRANEGVMNDPGALSPIGIDVQQTVRFPDLQQPIVVLKVKLTNTSGQERSNVGSGYFLDWDIGSDAVNNRARLAPEAIPQSLTGPGSAAEVFTREGFDVTICHAVVSQSPSGVAQSATFPYAAFVNDQDGFSVADRISMLSSGTTMQAVNAGDLCSVIGMNYPGTLANGASYEYTVVITLGATANEATSRMRDVLPTAVSVQEDLETTGVRVYPNPARDVVTVASEEPLTSITIFDATGRAVSYHRGDGQPSYVLSTANLPTGVYVLSLRTTSSTTTSMLNIAR